MLVREIVLQRGCPRGEVCQIGFRLRQVGLGLRAKRALVAKAPFEAANIVFEMGGVLRRVGNGAIGIDCA